MAMSIQTSVTASPLKGYAGMLDVGAPHRIATARNGEASASIPFGKAVIWDPSTPATEQDVTLPAGSQTSPVMGITVHQHTFSKSWTDADGNLHGEVDATGLMVGTIFGVLRQGRIMVVAASNVTAGVSKLYVRSVAGLGETLGALEGAADASDMIDCSTKATWMSTVTAGNLAWLEVDFT